MSNTANKVGAKVLRQFVRYICTSETFRPVEHTQVRWLDWDADWPLAQTIWSALGLSFTQADWLAARDAGYGKHSGVGRVATCTTLKDNTPMRRVAEKLGYTFRDIQELRVEE